MMKKSNIWLVAFLFAVPFILFSCDETDGVVDPYANWTERNQRYIDSIANVAKSNPSEWKIVNNYKYPPQSLLGGEVNEYVYCKILESGDGEKPLFTDTVAVNYRGRLIPLYDGTTIIFDQSYQGDLDASTAVPTEFAVSNVITGWATALQSMHAGDRWMVYIPSELGYGEMKQATIPANSTLIFDIDLVDVIPLK